MESKPPEEKIAGRIFRQCVHDDGESLWLDQVKAAAIIRSAFEDKDARIASLGQSLTAATQEVERLTKELADTYNTLGVRMMFETAGTWEEVAERLRTRIATALDLKEPNHA